MKTIWKFPLEVTDSQDINIPFGAEILSLQMQAGIPCIWALVDPEMPASPMKILIYGTGHTIHDMNSLHYLGSFQLYAGALVFHAFQELATT